MKKGITNALKGICASVLLWTSMQAQAAYDDGCYSCDSCECNRFWVDADYLYWQIQNSPNSVPLLITGPGPVAPVIGDGTSSTVLSGKHDNKKWRSGGRFALGYWFNDDCCLGAEASYFFLPNQQKHKSVFSDGSLGSEILAMPYFDVTTGLESSFVLAAPEAFSALAAVKVKNMMQGAELNGLMNLPWDCGFRVNLLAGFRYWNFNDRLSLFTDSPAVGDPDDIFQTFDIFRTQNNFYGGQVGLCMEYNCDCFFVNAKAKVALGAMYEEVKIDGAFTTNEFTPGVTETFVGGLFAQPTNIGKHKRTQFSCIPEVNVNVGYQIMDSLRLQVGYTFIYVSDMLWASKQIDNNINPTQSAVLDLTPTPILVGEASPRHKFKTDNLWVQGVNVGLEFQF